MNSALVSSEALLFEKDVDMRLKLHREIFNHLDVGLHIYQLEDRDNDSSLRMVLANKASEHFTGVKVADVVGKTLDENFPHLREQGIPQLYAEVVRTRKTIDVGELHYGDQRVHKACYLARAFPLIKNFMGVSFTNITKRKKMDIALNNYQNQLRTMAIELVATEERERRKIATELHDSIGQSLAFFKIKLNQICDSGLSPEQITEMNKIQNIISHTIDAVRSLTFEISPPILYELGLQDALEGLIEEFQKQYAIHIVYKRKKLTRPLDNRFNYPLFRAVREILLNFIKHARTQTVEITVRETKTNLIIMIEDRGCGFDPAKILPSEGTCSGFGLFSIYERIRHLGGDFEIKSKPGYGSRFTFLIPS